MAAYLRFSILVLAVAMLTGCSSSLQDGTARAVVTVTLDGAPVEGAAVVFTPEAGGRSASGLTDAAGRADMGTTMTGDGVFPGPYQVTVIKSMDDPAFVEEENYSGPGIPPSAKQIYLVPQKYISTTTSGLTAAVNAGEANAVNLELTSS